MKSLYKIVSAVFQPLLLPTFAVIWLMNIAPFVDFPTKYRFIAIGFTALFTGIFPLSSILILMRQGFVSNFNITNKDERMMPYLFSFLAYMLWWVFLWRTLQLPAFICSVGLSSAIALAITLFINFKWKISAHLCAMGGVFAFVVGVSFKMGENPICLIITLLAVSALLAISRVALKQHTPLQVLAGFSVGFVCTILPTILLN